MRSTKGTIKLLKKWNQLNSQNNDFNQLTFQEAVYATSVNGRVLPIRYFPSGNIFFEEMSENARKYVCMIHNNFLVGKHKKIHRFKYFNLWHSGQSKGI